MEKFTLSFLKKSTTSLIRKHDRFNPHLYWRFLLIGVFLALTAVFAYFILFFFKTSQVLDAPIAPTPNETLPKVRRMQRDLESIRPGILSDQSDTQILGTDEQ